MIDPERPKIADELNRFEEACRQRNLRVTHQRIEIYRELVREAEHPSAEDVYRRVRRRLRTISLDTVYRTLTTFEEHGLIKRVHALDNRARFDTNLALHHHLVCKRCQRVADFYWPDFDRLTPPAHTTQWGSVDLKHVELQGICNSCRSNLKK